jgi:hypothetical protein
MPQHLRQSELVGGNALVDAGTFIAILIGTISGGLLVPTTPRRCRRPGRAREHRRGHRHDVVALGTYACSRSSRAPSHAIPDLEVDFQPACEPPGRHAFRGAERAPS